MHLPGSDASGTNPDMLHTGILPHHTRWVKMLEDLRFIVIGELHTYRGVFGSHMANLLRRLRRVAAFYGSDPQIICCSATIANPRDLAERLTGRPFRLVADDGSPAAERHIILNNPPVVDRRAGIRQSSMLADRKVIGEFVRNGIQTIVFARSRLRVEILLSYLRETAPRANIRGYLPAQCRAIERGLRDGEIDAGPPTP